MRVELPYGSRPYPVTVSGDRPVTVLEAAHLPPPSSSVRDLISAALDTPRGGPDLGQIPPRARVTVIVSDETRDEPRSTFIEVLRERLPADTRWTLAIATGTHGPSPGSLVTTLGIPPDLARTATIINHDGHAPSPDLVELGVTTRGTPVRLHRCVLDADLVVATGCIRPHYFAGFGAGAKAIFPGLGEATAIRVNHQLKLDPRARAGLLDGNPCREDLEEAVALVPTPVFLLNGVIGPDDQLHAAVAGDLQAAFRAGTSLATPWFTVEATPAPLVIASDALPVTASLYQAAKIAAAAAPLVAPGGTLVLAAECPDGIGPLHTVNEAIFRIGILPRLAPGTRLVLVSGLSRTETNQTLLAYGDSLDSIFASTAGPCLILPHASKLLAHPLPSWTG